MNAQIGRLDPQIALAHLMRQGHPASLVGVEHWKVQVGTVSISIVNSMVFAKTDRGEWLMVSSIAELDGWLAGGRHDRR